MNLTNITRGHSVSTYSDEPDQYYQRAGEGGRILNFLHARPHCDNNNNNSLRGLEVSTFPDFHGKHVDEPGLREAHVLLEVESHRIALLSEVLHVLDGRAAAEERASLLPIFLWPRPPQSQCPNEMKIETFIQSKWLAVGTGAGYRIEWDRAFICFTVSNSTQTPSLVSSKLPTDLS